MSANQEKLSTTPENNFEATHELGQELNDILRDNREKIGESSPERVEKSKEAARADALETAVSVEKAGRGKEKTAAPTTRRGSIKRERDVSYKRTMKHVQAELSRPSRAFSKLIHNKTIESASEAAGATIARPNSILAGAIAAFICTLGLYLVAKRFGYQLSGFETIGAFAIGWLIGLLFDFFRIMITGKR